MSPFLRAGPDGSVRDRLVEALDRVRTGILLLDGDLKVRWLNRSFSEIFNLPPSLAVSGAPFRALLEHAARSLPGMPAPDLAVRIDEQEAATRAGTIASAHIDFNDGRRFLLACDACPGGGRILTYVDVSGEPRPETLDVMAQLNAELRFNNETMEDHAAHLASLAEATEESAQKIEAAKQELEREIIGRRLLEAQLRRMATTDALTGALNRAGFLALSQSELDRTDDPGRDLAVLMLDVDHFKLINDRFGHAGGDLALRHLVDLISGQSRRGDLLGRLGGEEFAILLCSIAPDQARRAAERLVTTIAEHPVRYDDKLIPMTVSVGVASFVKADRSIETLIARADDALYRAKRDGRNRVVVDHRMAAP